MLAVEVQSLKDGSCLSCISFKLQGCQISNGRESPECLISFLANKFYHGTHFCLTSSVSFGTSSSLICMFSLHSVGHLSFEEGESVELPYRNRCQLSKTGSFHMWSTWLHSNTARASYCMPYIPADTFFSIFFSW